LAILMPRIQNDPPKLPSLPGQPKGLQAWLLKGMARKPEDRFQSAGEMLAALEALGPGGDDALPFALPDDFDLGDEPSAGGLPPPAGGLPPPAGGLPPPTVGGPPSPPPPSPGTSDLGPPLAGAAHSLDFGAAFGDLSAPLAASILPELSVPVLAPDATPPPPHLLPEVVSGPGRPAPPVAVPVARPIRVADPRAPTEPAARAVPAPRRSSKRLLVGLGAALAVGLVVSMAALSDAPEAAEASEAGPSKTPASGGLPRAIEVVATPASQAAEPADAEPPPAPSAWRISAHAALSALPWSPHAPLPMALGDRHACAVGRMGAVRCWGSNLNGALGDGTQTPRATPAPVVGLLGGAARVASGSGHACAVLAGGEVRCWGANDKGQLGNGGQDRQSEPVAVRALPGPAAEVAAGSGHTCTLTRAGSVWCWGANDKGQLGDGTTIDRLNPVEVAGLEAGVVSLAAHASQTCVLIADATDITRPGGEVRCWGDNEHGELGDGRRDPSPVPVKVEGLDQPVVAISVGTSHACAAMAGGGARCWGENSRGQLGDGTAATRRRAVAVSGPRETFKVIAAGGEHTCALTEGGAVRCWGLNMNGQLGDGTSEDHRRPVSANGLETGVQGLVVGGNRTCVRGAGDTVMCWGANAHGQLGDGSTTDRAAPTEVLSGCCE
jgi:alpha-tubulin suppressor-like RCC1 family protein